MKRTAIIALVAILSVVIVLIITLDVKSTRTGNRPGNKYEVDIDEFMKVDPDLIGYKEIRNYTFESETPDGIACRLMVLVSCNDPLISCSGHNPERTTT